MLSSKPGESNANEVRIPCIVFFVITPIFLAIRIWTRFAKGSGLGADDWTIFASFAFTLIIQILMLVSVHHGFGQHIHNLATPNKLMALKMFYVAQIFYKVTINLTKTSILLLYLRIFVQRWFRICCYALMAIILSYMVATVAAAVWQCSPVRGAWDKSIHPNCISLTKNWYANAGFSISTDIIILLLPMQPIWTSRLPIGQKRALMIVFAMGSFVTITSILRSTTLTFSTKTPDPTYDITSTLWTMIEENVGIICACLPMCRMPLSRIFPNIFGSGIKATLSNSGHMHRGSSGPASSQDWKPYSGGQGGKHGGTVHTVVARQVTGDDTSEEYILSSNSRMASEDITRQKGSKAIIKTTLYEVSYELGGEKKA